MRIQDEIEALLYGQQPHTATKTEPAVNGHAHNGQAKGDKLSRPGENLDF